MNFNSYEFLIFFPVVVLIYFIIPKKARYIWLLIASYFFYMSWNPKYGLLLLFATCTTYIGSRLINHANLTIKDEALCKKRKKIFVILSILINLSVLFFFKYYNFFMDNINGLLSSMNMQMVDRPFDIVLPVGISFFTFQALGYIIDVYRKDVQAEKNFFRYALFVSFFPTLLSGPIERSKNLLKQIDEIEKIRVWNFKNVSSGLAIMLWGFFMKLVIADRISVLVATVYNSYWMYGSVELILAAVIFAIQIYCDFAGYSTIAIGAAKVMGFDLMENFRTPYLASGIRDFWRRWHIALSTWFRDYLYIPLGGNRCSKRRKYFNTMVTFLVSGLWHGANWTFLMWGAIHGAFQILEAEISPRFKKLNDKLGTKVESFSYRFGIIFITFTIVCFAWIFFRSATISDAFNYISRIFTKWDPWVLFNDSLYNLGLSAKEFNIAIVAIATLLLFDIIKYVRKEDPYVFLDKQCIWFRWLIYIVLIFAIVIFGIYGPAYDKSSFIYFQF
jgi:Predicted membrane protein involved in D-alanine export